jgi:DNA-binding CsgD family transcriptional regulator
MTKKAEEEVIDDFLLISLLLIIKKRARCLGINPHTDVYALYRSRNRMMRYLADLLPMTMA